MFPATPALFLWRQPYILRGQRSLCGADATSGVRPASLLLRRLCCFRRSFPDYHAISGATGTLSLTFTINSIYGFTVFIFQRLPHFRRSRRIQRYFFDADGTSAPQRSLYGADYIHGAL